MKDLKGKIFGRLKPYEPFGRTKSGGVIWKCLCTCGNKVGVAAQHLTSGHTKSCGCLYRPMKDLTGMVFERLTVVREVDRLQNCIESCWECECSCGGKIVRPGSQLRNGTTRSCGCLHREVIRRKRTPKGWSGGKRLLRSYKRMAKKRGYSWELEESTFFDLTKGNCYWCDRLPSQISGDDPWSSYTYNGIDRKDNTIGYTKDNTVSCCGICNLSKTDKTEEEWLDMIKRIAVKHNLVL